MLLANGGKIIKPNLTKNVNKLDNQYLISKQTSKKIINILRKVVTDKEGTASLADVDGFYGWKNWHFSKLQ